MFGWGGSLGPPAFYQFHEGTMFFEGCCTQIFLHKAKGGGREAPLNEALTLTLKHAKASPCTAVVRYGWWHAHQRADADLRT